MLHSRQVDPAHVDEVMRQAEDSVDEWTAPGREHLGFREGAHFLLMSRYEALGHIGAVISFNTIVNSLIPADL